MTYQWHRNEFDRTAHDLTEADACVQSIAGEGEKEPFNLGKYIVEHTARSPRAQLTRDKEWE